MEDVSLIDSFFDFFLDKNHPWRKIFTFFTILLIILLYLIKSRKELSIILLPLKFLIKKIIRIFEKNDVESDFSLDHNYVNRPNNIFVPNDRVLEELANKILHEPRICVLGLAGVGKTTVVRQLCYSQRLNYFEYKYEIDFESVNSPIIDKKETIEESFNNAQNILFTKFNIERGSSLESFVKNTFKKPSLLFIDNYEQISANRELDSKIRNELIQPFINNNFHIVITSRDEATDFESFVLGELKNIEIENLDSVESMSSDELVSSYPAIKLFFKIHNKCRKEKKEKKRDIYKVEEIKTIIELCHKVSNLPLGIMILATRSVEFSVKKINDNLEESLRTSLPVSFSITSNRQRNLYNAFLWSFNLLTEEEQRFFAHLTFYKNSTLLTNIPKWLSHKNQNETTKIMEKLYSQNLINRTIDPYQKKYRYELYYITREMFSEKMLKESISLNMEYCESICRSYYNRLSEIESLIFEFQSDNIDYKEIVTEVRLDIENGLGFINWCTTHRKNLAVDILIKLENILNEIGPYIFLKELFIPLLNEYKTGINRARILITKARVVKSTDERDKAEIYIDEALSILEEEKSINTLLGKAYSVGSYLYGELGMYEKRKRIIDIVSSFSTEQKKAISTLNLGLIILERARHYENKGEIKLAVKHFQESIELLKGYDVQLSKALNYAAIFFWRVGEAKKAEEYFFEAIYRYTDIGENRWVLGFKTNLGLLFADMEKIEEGIKYTIEASKSLEKEGPYGWYVVNLLSQGRLISRTSISEEDYDKAKSLLLESYKKFEIIQWFESMALSMVELAELNYNHSKYYLALKWSNKAIEMCTINGMNKSMRLYRGMIINSLSNSKLGDVGKARELKKKAQSLYDSVKDNNWLVYSICNEKYKELKDI